MCILLCCFSCLYRSFDRQFFESDVSGVMCLQVLLLHFYVSFAVFFLRYSSRLTVWMFTAPFCSIFHSFRFWSWEMTWSWLRDAHDFWDRNPDRMDRLMVTRSWNFVVSLFLPPSSLGWQGCVQLWYLLPQQKNGFRFLCFSDFCVLIAYVGKGERALQYWTVVMEMSESMLCFEMRMFMPWRSMLMNNKMQVTMLNANARRRCGCWCPML